MVLGEGCGWFTRRYWGRGWVDSVSSDKPQCKKCGVHAKHMTAPMHPPVLYPSVTPPPFHGPGFSESTQISRFLAAAAKKII